MMFDAAAPLYAPFRLNIPTEKEQRKRFNSKPSASSGFPHSLKALRKHLKLLDTSSKPNYRNTSNPKK